MGSSDSLIKLMSMVTNNAKVTINNQTMSFSEMIVKKTSDGGTVVMIDGVPAVGDDVIINIEVNGDVQSITLGSGTVKCANVTNGIKTVSGDIFCENVYGNITSTSGDVQCDDVAGNISTVSGDINCDDIGGNASTISGNIY
ncbi:Phage protein [Yersinia phage fHe-Yen9-04]|uniref:Phage protein n=2 Tax=Eneladusvirus Yen904 TaxID=2560849 RepID=A0A2C9CZB5_9CAUD|nr:Phage protein [Yersinia phage fHe-Yen9-04]SOK58362.1 Phage protein [Yersinia phage fHe-Yen9-04]SOK58897.1 Phage protein [Yersinia phage fHe-Yen9-03]VUE36131.1 Phage protein [Yersinia phage fHe-Yen9-04]